MTNFSLPARSAPQRRLIVPALLALLFMPFAAGCGATSPTTTVSTTGTPASNPADAAFAYSRCIRAHGVTSFPDPHVSTTQNGASISQGVPASAGASPQFKSAETACRGILPAPGNSSSGDQQSHRQTLLVFARCLRSHGLAGFPDPNHAGQITPAMISAAGIDLHSTQFQRAGAACVGVTHGAITLGAVREAASAHH